MRISKVTTKTGDAGQTGLSGGERVSKSHLRIHALGAIDHLNSVIGWTIVPAMESLKSTLKTLQQDLFNLGGELSMPGSEMVLLNSGRLEWLESEIDNLNEELPPLKEFILPGGSELSARIHISRTETRNTERELVLLNESEKIPELHIQYLNRLSDYFFVLARSISITEKHEEIQWNHQK